MNKHETMSYWGAIVTVLGGLTLNDWGVVMGILFGFLSLLMGWYYKHKEYQLKEKALKHKINLEKLENE